MSNVGSGIVTFNVCRAIENEQLFLRLFGRTGLMDAIRTRMIVYRVVPSRRRMRLRF